MTFEDAAKYAPLATALIALAAATIGYLAIRAQRDIARRRASIDFFIKTEIDPHAIELYRRFRAAVPTMQALAERPDVERDEDFRDVRAYLDICELVAVGIKEKAFSDRISYAYWGDVLPRTLADGRPLIERIRQTAGEGTVQTYTELKLLCERWATNPPHP